MKALYLLSLAFLTTLSFSQSAIAVPAQNFDSLADSCPLSNETNLPNPPLSQVELSIPSLWLAKQQYGGKLIDSWFITSEKNWVILVVNRQLWSLLDYLERYQFVNRFGTIVRQDGYNIRVCNRQGVTLAIYSCAFSEARTDDPPLKCQIELDTLNSSGLTQRRKLF